MRVLLVEDDKQLAELVARVLKREGIQADVAHDGDLGLEMALTNAYDVAIVDWMLPKRDGRSICLAVRHARALADTHAHCARPGGGSRVGPGQRCRRLPHQALRHGGVVGACARA